jgi:periplasmic nitrate reductase NapE
MRPREPAAPSAIDDAARKRRMEIYAFLIITAVAMPGIAVATVGTWGLTVWIYQAIHGPPGPPSK